MPRRSRRFVVRVMSATFLTVALVLGSVFTVLVFHTRAIVEARVAENLDAGQRQLGLVERERQAEAVLRASVLSENPMLKAALDTYQAELAFDGSPQAREQGLATVRGELAKIARVLQSDAIAVVGPDGRILASSGPYARVWAPNTPVAVGPGVETEVIARLDGLVFRATRAPIAIEHAQLAELVVATLVDERYARQLAGLARTGVAVVVDGHLHAATLDDRARAALVHGLQAGLGESGHLRLDGDRYAYRRLRAIGPAAFYAIDSITAARDRVSAAALPKLVAIALGGLVLCGLASVRLARAVSAPIDLVTREIAAMAAAQETARVIVPPDATREVETLGETFNTLMRALQESRAETDAAYLGAIGALAAALDARDEYTAGHSERVSRLAVAMAAHMGLDRATQDVVRLGALLHDIGKIGIPDTILGKPAPLDEDEYEAIKRHTLLGAQILRPVTFLAPHIPIVELHHERPDGRGYPYGLRGDATPLVARIVHVADAFDAMTSARAYRAGMPVVDALAELWREAGSGFDVPALQALAAVLPAIPAVPPEPAARPIEAPAPVLAFERRVS
jgi:putative nucleotidyltransferase with HDIG domain